VVFVVGLEKGLAPYTPPGRKKSADPAEERRLFFVAMTRAKRRLFLTRSRARSLFGKNTRPAPSPFLEEIEASLKLNDQLPDRPAKPAATRQMTLF
jgi:superfamily I DNA/RNA helicase